ncbi:transposase family protein, partial [Klebsiella pneumoniae]|nr:transposase family protein [Klebsiella pneumoniae]
GGKHFVLVGLEIISGPVQAEAFNRATGESTVKALRQWFGTFPKPQEIQSDNGSHFTARIVQYWARSEGIKWIFHTPYYPQWYCRKNQWFAETTFETTGRQLGCSPVGSCQRCK